MSTKNGFHTVAIEVDDVNHVALYGDKKTLCGKPWLYHRTNLSYGHCKKCQNILKNRLGVK